MIVFEKVGSNETVGIDRETGGKYFNAKLSALINSSDLSINADRGQDYGWRLQAEQRALIELWESDPEMIEKVMQFTKVPMDELSHTEFLMYFVYQQDMGKSPERSAKTERREAELDYERRVAELKAAARPEVLPAFQAPDVTTIEDFVADETPKAKKK